MQLLTAGLSYLGNREKIDLARDQGKYKTGWGFFLNGKPFTITIGLLGLTLALSPSSIFISYIYHLRI